MKELRLNIKKRICIWWPKETSKFDIEFTCKAYLLTVNRYNKSFSQVIIIIITGRICPKGISAGIVFTHGPIFGFFAPQHRCTDQGQI